ncbi:MAG: folate-binding protein YgfZ [Aquificae bacterium]|nr:folate-binding protein YgfZ [Aquificota bacterium]
MKWIKIDRTKIKVYGKKGKVLPKGFLEEHISFLQSTLTNDIASLKSGEFNYNLWLTGNGQPKEEFYVYRDDNFFILDTCADAKKIIDEFTKIKLSLQVFFEDLTLEYAHIYIFGEDSEKFLKNIFENIPEKFKFFKKDNIYIAQNPLRIGETGFDIFGKIEKIRDLFPKNQKIEEEEFEDIRIKNCVPKIHKELKEGFHPLEANIGQYAFSFTKGCYIGQEAIARVHFRGRTPRTLTKFVLQGDIKEDDQIFEGEKKVGVITSVSPKSEVGLGYILRTKLKEDTQFLTQKGKVKPQKECVLKL